MDLQRIELRNFRCFRDFTLDVNGEPLLVIGPNAGGKTSLVTGIRRALQGGSVELRELRDQTIPIELIATVSGIPPAAQGDFADVLDFGTTPPTLRIGLRAAWDAAELRVDTVHGFPDAGWRPARREARRNLPVISLPSWRDPARLLPVVGRQSLLQELVVGLPLDQALTTAVTAITDAGEQLAHAQPLQQLLSELRDELDRVLPKVAPNAFSLGLDVAQPHDVLDQLELLLVHRGPATPASTHSGGVTQATMFALALRLLAARPDALLLVDEPESALHPQAQRALVAALRATAHQSVIATHSAMVLDRLDPRHVTRLRRAAAGDTEAVRASGLTADGARKVSRYATSQTAEAYFAETVIVVEGFSDLLAVRALARKLGINLDAAGVSLISLEGATLFQHYLQLLGPAGLEVELRGLVDDDHEADWMARLNAAGIAVIDRATLKAAGFHVCDPDLEAELVAPLSAQDVEAVFDGDGALGEFRTFAGQPQQAGLAVADVQMRFIKKDKVRWAPLLADAVPVAAVPAPIVDLLSNL